MLSSRSNRPAESSPNSSCSSRGTPSRSPITMAGTGVANSRARSAGEPAASRASSRSATAASTRGVSSASRRAPNDGGSNRRSRGGSGGARKPKAPGSARPSSSASSPASRLAKSLLKVLVSDSTARTSAYRVTSQMVLPNRSSRLTGSSARRWASSGTGSTPVRVRGMNSDSVTPSTSNGGSREFPVGVSHGPRVEPDQGGELGHRAVEEPVGVLDRADEVPEQLEADGAVDRAPGQQRAHPHRFVDRRVVAAEHLDRGVAEQTRVAFPGRLGQQPRPGGVAEDRAEDDADPDRRRHGVLRRAVAGDGGAVEQRVLVRMGPRPGADGPADGEPSLPGRGRGVVGLLGGAPERVVALDDQPGQQVVAAGEVPVDRRGRHPQLPGDRPQGERGGAHLGQL